LPHLQKLYEKYHGDGFVLIAFNMLAQQNEMLPEWKAKGKYTFPIFVTDDKDYFATNPFDVRGTPTSFLLDADGKIIFRHVGYSSGAEKIMEAEIRELLGLDPFEGQEAATESLATNR
jgi:glutathione peroxidase-family protein